MVAMKAVSKEQLRHCAKRALEERGYMIERVLGQGIVPGVQLKATKGRRVLTIAVRTTNNRKLGLVRAENGKWRTISTVDEVVVAASAEKRGYAEVFGFDPDDIIKRFDAELSELIKRMPKLKKIPPVFVNLDDKHRKTSNKDSGLKTKATWSLFVPIAAVAADNSGERNAGFIERVKREFAELNGVDLSKVHVNFSIDA